MKFAQTFILIIIVNFLHSQAGNLDTSFGNDGKIITEFEQIDAEVYGMAIQSDGKIILSGTGISDSDQDIIVVRYLSNGVIDSDFAIDGKFRMSISDFRDICYDVAVDSFGSILLTGFTFNENFEAKGFVVKLNTNGKIDSTFAQNGVWLSQEPDTREDFRKILIQADGKLIIAGKTSINGQSVTSTVIRLNSEGTLDENFGQNGIAKMSVPDNYNPRFAKLNSDNEIIAGGFLLGNSTNVIITKFTQQGEIDLSFGNDGIMIDDSSMDEFGNNIAIQSDDKILVAIGATTTSGRDFGLARFNNNGSVDSSFGINGKIYTDFSQSSNTSHSVAIQDDGKIVLSGFLGTTPNHDYAIARYDTLGNLDISFGDGGKVITNFGLDDLAFISSIQPDGKLLCAGNSKETNGSSFFSMARFLTRTGTSSYSLPTIVNSINVFPNPSNGNFDLGFNLTDSGVGSIDILNLSGELIYEVVRNRYFTKGENTIRIDLKNNLSTGLYVLSIQTDRGVANHKFVLKR